MLHSHWVNTQSWVRDFSPTWCGQSMVRSAFVVASSDYLAACWCGKGRDGMVPATSAVGMTFSTHACSSSKAYKMD